MFDKATQPTEHPTPAPAIRTATEPKSACGGEQDAHGQTSAHDMRTEQSAQPSKSAQPSSQPPERAQRTGSTPHARSAQPIHGESNHPRTLPVAALVIAVGLDRLVFAPIFDDHEWHANSSSIITLCYVAFWALVAAVFHLVLRSLRRESGNAAMNHGDMAPRVPPTFRNRLKPRRIAVATIATAQAGVGTWLVTFALVPAYAGNGEYASLAYVAMPWLAMLQSVIAVGPFDVHRPGRVAGDWFAGWFVSPFNALNRIPSAIMQAVRPDPHGDDSKLPGLAAAKRRETIMRTVAAVTVAAALTLTIGALLASADQMFALVIDKLIDEPIGRIESGPFLAHLTAILVVAALAFSHLWNIVRRVEWTDPRSQRTADGTAGGEDLATSDAPHDRAAKATLPSSSCMIVLGALLALYAVFCAVQFTFLFAGAGLPAGYTYAQYARQGFFQLLAVALINFAVFGVVLTYARTRTRALTVMLVALLAATGVMLASAFVRLALYIVAYGLTWLRFSSMAFIGLLAVVIVLALVRLREERLPLVAACFALFLVWFVVLGFVNPGAIIDGWEA